MLTNFSSGLCNNPKLFSNLPSGGEPRVLQSEMMRTSSQTSEVHSGSKWIRCDILKPFAFFKYSFQRFKQIEERLEYLSKDNRSVSITCSV